MPRTRARRSPRAGSRAGARAARADQDAKRPGDETSPGRFARETRSFVLPTTAATTFAAPALVVVAFDEPLIRPVRRLVAPRTVLSPIPRTALSRVPRIDPTSTGTRLVPAAALPRPLIALPVPGSVDPDGIATRPSRPLLVPHSWGSFGRNADVERTQVGPNLGTRWNRNESGKRCEHQRSHDASVHLSLLTERSRTQTDFRCSTRSFLARVPATPVPRGSSRVVRRPVMLRSASSRSLRWSSSRGAGRVSGIAAAFNGGRYFVDCSAEQPCSSAGVSMPSRVRA